MSLLQQFYQASLDADADKKIKAAGGKATLYKRSSTKHWQVRFKLANNKWHSQSTYTEDADQAIANAERIYQTVQIKTEAGLSIEVDSAPALIKALELVKLAVEAGELDTQIASASANVRKVFDK